MSGAVGVLAALGHFDRVPIEQDQGSGRRPPLGPSPALVAIVVAIAVGLALVLGLVTPAPGPVSFTSTTSPDPSGDPHLPPSRSGQERTTAADAPLSIDVEALADGQDAPAFDRFVWLLGDQQPGEVGDR